MFWLMIKLWPYLALAFLIGVAVSWVTCYYEEEEQQGQEVDRFGRRSLFGD